MAYDKKKLFNQAKEVIERYKPIFIEEVVAYLPCSKPTFYDYFKVDSNEFNTLKELIEENRVKLKTSMRAKWYKSDTPALQLALYKLASTPDELKKLSMTHNDVTTNGNELQALPVSLNIVTNLSEQKRLKKNK